MYDYSDADNSPYQLCPEAISPDRPPQLNQTICGCRCGRGSGGLGDGDGDGKNDEDAAATLVSSVSSDSGSSDTLSPDNEHPHMNFNAVHQPHSPRAEQPDDVGTKRSSSMSNVQSFGFSAHAIGLEGLSAGPRPHEHYDMTSDSFHPELFGGNDHNAISERSDIRPISPGPGIGALVEGIGAWVEGTWAESEQLEYHFLARPLRLSPQHRHCRGLVASHLVLRDQMSPVYLLDDE